MLSALLLGTETRTKPSTGNTNTRKVSTTSKSDVPAPPSSLGVGGKASLQPKRAPVTKEEMEAILVRLLPPSREIWLSYTQVYQDLKEVQQCSFAYLRKNMVHLQK